MSSTALCQKPSVNCFALNTERPQINTTTSPLDWDSGYNDPALLSSDSCDSFFPSPSSPESLPYPDNTYTLPQSEIKPEFDSDEAFNFGTFEDWMRWDDPTDAALSPTSDLFPELKTEAASPNMTRLDRNTQDTRMISTSTLNDDAAVFGEDTMSEEPLFQSPANLINEMPPREGLYSTPLSWTRPSLGQRTQAFNTILSPQEESKLRSIAMPSHTQYPTSPDSLSSPEPNDVFTNNNRKRKSSVEDDEDDDECCAPSSNGSSRQAPKKTAHNMIEKRYRTNLNDKIAALRDSVPSLRVMVKKNSRGEDIQEDLQGLTPAHKLNKATVLSKATEYIAHLEKRNKYLAKENSGLKARVDAFEILVMSRQPQPLPQQQQSQQQQQQHQQQRNSIARQGSSRGFDLDGMLS